jgi:hypothetical protein
VNSRRTTPEDIRWAYRILLGREAEAPEVILHHMQNSSDLKSLVMAFVQTDEFKDRFPKIQVLDQA